MNIWEQRYLEWLDAMRSSNNEAAKFGSFGKEAADQTKYIGAEKQTEEQVVPDEEESGILH